MLLFPLLLGQNHEIFYKIKVHKFNTYVFFYVIYCLGLGFRALIHFELILYVVTCQFSSHSFACGFPIFPAPFTVEAFFPPLYVFASFVEGYLSTYMWVYFWTLNSVPLVLCLFFYQYHTFLIIVTLWYNLKSESVITLGFILPHPSGLL